MALTRWVIPNSYFGILLGLLSTGLAWRYASQNLPWGYWISESSLMTGSILWIIFMLFFLLKPIFHWQQCKQELQHPIQGCFLSLIPITTILLGVTVMPAASLLGSVLIILGTVFQLIFASYHSAGFWRGTHVLEATTPVVYLPTVAANFASAIGFAALGLSDWGYLFLGAGIFSWFSLEAVILQRLRTAEPLSEDIRPILGIQLAPAFVCGAAYLAVSGGDVDSFAKALLGYGLLNGLFLIRIFPWIFKKGFTISLWAFSFGIGSMVNMGAHVLQTQTSLSMHVLGMALVAIGTVLIVLLALGSIHWFFFRSTGLSKTS